MRYLPRKKLLVDWKVQGALLMRAAVYWFLFAVTFFQITLSWQIAKGPDGPFLSHFDLAKWWDEYSVVAIAGLLMLPVVLLDTAFISNRIVGPLVRVRRTLRKMAAGDVVEPLQFRQNDFLKDLAGEFNAVIVRMNRLNEQAQACSEPEIESHEEPAAVG